MSFIKKGIKKIVDFVKDNWKTIVMVAAVAFTAGIVTVGVAGFQASVAANGFLQTVGSTMWAGVTATAGSMGIGSGASTAAFGGPAAFGGASHVGLGAAMGAGGGYGLGAAGKTAAESAAVAAAGNTPGTGVLASLQGAPSTVPAVTNPATGEAVAGEVLAKSASAPVTEAGKSLVAGEAAGEGMSMGRALVYSQMVQTGGAALQGYAEGKALEDQINANKPKALYGVATGDGGDRTAPVEDYLFEGAVMQPLAGDTADATTAANQLTMRQAQAPLMNIARPMAAMQPGQARGSEPGRGVSYSPQQMLGGPGLTGRQGLMQNDPRNRALLAQPNFMMQPIDNWRLRG